MTSVEMLLAAAMVPTNHDQDDYVAPNPFAAIAEIFLNAFFEAVLDLAQEYMERVVAKLAAELVGELAGKVPYIGWILGPALECGIKEANNLPC